MKFQLGAEANFAASTLTAFQVDSSYSERSFDYLVPSAVTPNMLSMIALLCVTAAILCCVVPRKDAEPPEIGQLSYREGVALAAVSTGTTVVMGGLLGAIVISVFRLLV
ncbi:MAG: hypothetical protein ACYTGL_10285 [Planctomycetota bacterium]